LIEITQFDNKTVAGRYYEVYKPGYEEYAATQLDFKFDGKRPDEKNRPDFDVTTESGTKGNFYADQYTGKINFNLNNQSMGSQKFDGIFSPDLD